MGQRGAGAVFMPEKFVFPGGAVEVHDHEQATVPALAPICTRRLEAESSAPPGALIAAALRELREESGQMPHASRAASLRFFMRAITPPGRPRRFDARFFLLDASELRTNPDDFGASDQELRHIQWIPLDEVRRFDIAFITQIALAELAAHLPRTDPPERVAFIRNDDPVGGLTWL